MEITQIIETLSWIYRVPCNMEGEPEFAFGVKDNAPVEFRYEVRERGEMKSIVWSTLHRQPGRYPARRM